MANLKVEIEQKPQAVIAKLDGEAGVDEADELSRNLRLLTAAKPAVAILDLGGLSYIASMGIGALVRFRNDLTQAGGRVLIANCRPLVFDTFRHAGLQRVFQIFPTVDEALAASAISGTAAPASNASTPAR
ncbi:MAG TPA: STAS domain-containing protein [Tepidisphaeraceae bacterium]|nr:STAS domain-containing protein [Tepidisphaeraceae bacterium]